MSNPTGSDPDREGGEAAPMSGAGIGDGSLAATDSPDGGTTSEADAVADQERQGWPDEPTTS
jgi:hypothetical protein